MERNRKIEVNEILSQMLSEIKRNGIDYYERSEELDNQSVRDKRMLKENYEEVAKTVFQVSDENIRLVTALSIVTYTLMNLLIMNSVVLILSSVLVVVILLDIDKYAIKARAGNNLMLSRINPDNKGLSSSLLVTVFVMKIEESHLEFGLEKESDIANFVIKFYEGVQSLEEELETEGKPMRLLDTFHREHLEDLKNQQKVN